MLHRLLRTLARRNGPAMSSSEEPQPPAFMTQASSEIIKGNLRQEVWMTFGIIKGNL